MCVATREPSPLSSSKRIQLGDVGYIHEGGFHLLFSAGHSSGEGTSGTDLPLNFKQLPIGDIVERAPLAAGCLCTDGVRATQFSPATPPSQLSASPTSKSPSPVPPSYVDPVTPIYLGALQYVGLLDPLPPCHFGSRRAAALLL